MDVPSTKANISTWDLTFIVRESRPRGHNKESQVTQYSARLSQAVCKRGIGENGNLERRIND
jgi:hypothetical protein